MPDHQQSRGWNATEIAKARKYCGTADAEEPLKAWLRAPVFKQTTCSVWLSKLKRPFRRLNKVDRNDLHHLATIKPSLNP
jgi:hypothetical protein